MNLRTPDVIITELNDSYPNNTVETSTGSLMTEVSLENDMKRKTHSKVPKKIGEIRSLLTRPHATDWLRFITALTQ